MDKKRINIVVIEPSDIVYEGLFSLIMKAENNLYVYRLQDLSDIEQLSQHGDISTFIINPSIIQYKIKEFTTFKSHYAHAQWIALLYSLFPENIIQLFDHSFAINDEINKIIQIIIHNMRTEQDAVILDLSDREIEILLLLINGLSAREIGEKLDISVNTVISHRKNITEKTGIKTLSGLTIYALSKKLIPMDYNLY